MESINLPQLPSPEAILAAQEAARQAALARVLQANLPQLPSQSPEIRNYVTNASRRAEARPRPSHNHAHNVLTAIAYSQPAEQPYVGSMAYWGWQAADRARKAAAARGRKRH